MEIYLTVGTSALFVLLAALYHMQGSIFPVLGNRMLLVYFRGMEIFLLVSAIMIPVLLWK